MLFFFTSQYSIITVIFFSLSLPFKLHDHKNIDTSFSKIQHYFSCTINSIKQMYTMINKDLPDHLKCGSEQYQGNPRHKHKLSSH